MFALADYIFLLFLTSSRVVRVAYDVLHRAGHRSFAEFSRFFPLLFHSRGLSIRVYAIVLIVLAACARPSAQLLFWLQPTTASQSNLCPLYVVPVPEAVFHPLIA